MLLLVDGISSIGSVPIEPEAWGCDVVVAGSQKGWMIPPGLAFVSISQRAWERQARARLPKFYFDWLQARRAADDGGTPWTPAVSLFFGLQTALGLMREPKVWSHSSSVTATGEVHPAKAWPTWTCSCSPTRGLRRRR